jgi:hypothetical protein
MHRVEGSIYTHAALNISAASVIGGASHFWHVPEGHPKIAQALRPHPGGMGRQKARTFGLNKIEMRPAIGSSLLSNGNQKERKHHEHKCADEAAN